MAFDSNTSKINQNPSNKAFKINPYNYYFTWLMLVLLFLLIILKALPLNTTWFSKFNFFLAIIIFIDFLILNKKLSKKSLNHQLGYFIILLYLFILNTAWFIGERYYFKQNIYNFPIYLNYLFIVWGLLFLPIVREKSAWILNKFRNNILKIQSDAKKDNDLSTRRVKEFNIRHNRLIKIPLFGAFVRWLYQEGWFSSIWIFASILVLIAFSVPLSTRFINGDEFHMFNVAKGFLETNKCVAWNFLYDMPGYIYESRCFIAMIISIFFRIFGISVLSAKLFFLIISVMNVFLLYLIGKKYLNKHLGLLFILLYTTNPFFIWNTSFLRGYILLVFLSLIILLLLPELLNKDNKLIKNITIAVLLIISLLIGTATRLFFFSFAVVIGLAIAVKIYQLLSAGKINKKFVYVIIIIITATISPVIINFIQKKSWAIDIKTQIDWHAFDLSLFVYNPTIARILIFLWLAIFFSMFINQLFKKNNSLELNTIFCLVGSFITLNFVYGFIARQSELIPRYTIPLMLTNISILIFSIYYLLLYIIKNRKLLFIIITAIIIYHNMLFFLNNRINNNWSSGYNYIDMYDLDRATSAGRLKDNTDQMYKIINDHILPQSDKIALITEYIHDPNIVKLKPFAEKIDLICPRWIPLKFTSVIQCEKNDYDSGVELMPLKKEVLLEYQSIYDEIYFVFSSRKYYKYKTQINYLENELSYAKISGSGINGSNIEIYYWKSNK